MGACSGSVINRGLVPGDVGRAAKCEIDNADADNPAPGTIQKQHHGKCSVCLLRINRHGRVERDLAVSRPPLLQHFCCQMLFALLIDLVGQVRDLHAEVLAGCQTSITPLGQHRLGTQPDEMACKLICRSGILRRPLRRLLPEVTLGSVDQIE